MVGEAKIPDTGGHGYLPQWSGTGPGAAGSSYRALWQSVQVPLSCSRSCAGGAVRGRKGRLTHSKREGAEPSELMLKGRYKQGKKRILMNSFLKAEQNKSFPTFIWLRLICLEIHWSAAIGLGRSV